MQAHSFTGRKQVVKLQSACGPAQRRLAHVVRALPEAAAQMTPEREAELLELSANPDAELSDRDEAELRLVMMREAARQQYSEKEQLFQERVNFLMSLEIEYATDAQRICEELVGMKRYHEALEMIQQIPHLMGAGPKYKGGEEIELQESQLQQCYFNQACLYSILDDVDNSLNCLDMSIQYGMKEFGKIDEDPDLKNTRADHRFEELMKKHGFNRDQWFALNGGMRPDDDMKRFAAYWRF